MNAEMPPLKMPKYIVVCDDGEGIYRHVGPFMGSVVATEWARHNFPGQPSRWMSVPLEEPEMPQMEVAG